jgi:hypothetical protein
MEQKFEEILKDGIEKCLKEIGISSLNIANQQQRGKALTDFYLKEIGAYLYQIYDDDITDGSCDSKSDLGIDFVLKRENEWLIFQSKYKGGGNQITSDEISGFFNVHSKLLDEEYFGKHANKTLKELLLDLKPEDNIQYIFITNSKLTNRNEDDFKSLQKQFENKYENLSFELKGLSDLKRDYKSVASEVESIAEIVGINVDLLEDSFTHKFSSAYFDLSSVIDREEKYKSIVCTIKGTTLRAYGSNISPDFLTTISEGF